METIIVSACLLGMETIIVSACLLGENTKYNGGNNYDSRIEKLKEKYNIIPICPESFGGLKIPREPSEIQGSFVVSKSGKDVTNQFNEGAHKVINIVNFMHVKKAVLMDRSPSCGVNKIYNGKFSHTLIDGQGYTARLLKEKGVELYTIDDIDKLLWDQKLVSLF